ncbi:unnamed protein product [Diplocarpon coronariae]|uniref:Uncharacterized protein n=1 Tax=Diplocarpon coronariae TaxID=2795749 RepID=A0A218YZ47_9HELO|nr:hypothetical protein B2J93_3736 [Marssonina coronariae]
MHTSFNPLKSQTQALATWTLEEKGTTIPPSNDPVVSAMICVGSSEGKQEIISISSTVVLPRAKEVGLLMMTGSRFWTPFSKGEGASELRGSSNVKSTGSEQASNKNAARTLAKIRQHILRRWVTVMSCIGACRAVSFSRHISLLALFSLLGRASRNAQFTFLLLRVGSLGILDLLGLRDTLALRNMTLLPTVLGSSDSVVSPGLLGQLAFDPVLDLDVLVR